MLCRKKKWHLYSYIGPQTSVSILRIFLCQEHSVELEWQVLIERNSSVTGKV